MALACNIDARGREHRYRIGRLLIGCGALLAGGVSYWVSGKLPWLLGGALVVAGLFALLEARLGWCVIRALGVKTRV